MGATVAQRYFERKYVKVMKRCRVHSPAWVKLKKFKLLVYYFSFALIIELSYSFKS
jgi:hypothetical protein